MIAIVCISNKTKATFIETIIIYASFPLKFWQTDLMTKFQTVFNLKLDNCLTLNMKVAMGHDYNRISTKLRNLSSDHKYNVPL